MPKQSQTIEGTAEGAVSSVPLLCQKWWCEHCLKKGTVQYPSHAGVWEVVQLLDDAHQKKSPDCPIRGRGLRVSA